MVAPLILKIVAFSLAKKVVVFLVAKLYGFPRLYRRASEFNHSVNRDNPKRREKFQNRLQFLFRLPRHIYQTVQRWRGVQPPQGPPSGQSHGTTNSHSQHKQVREIHTRSSALRISSLNVPNPSSSTSSGFVSISQSIRTHLLGLRGGNQLQNSRTRPFSVSCALPFGVSSLISPSKELESLQASSGHFSAVDGHVVQIKAESVPDSESGYLRTTLNIEHSVQSCSSQGASMEHSYRSVSETMVSKIDESRNSVQKSVGLSLIL